MHRPALALALCLAAAPASAADGPYLYDLMKKPAYRAAWSAILAGQPVAAWVRDLAGGGDVVATPVRTVKVGATAYTLAHGCKPHDCAGNEVEVMFAPGGAPAFAMLIDRAFPSPRYLGAPSPAQVQALNAAMAE